MSEYISTVFYRQYLALVNAAVKLPNSANLQVEDGSSRDFTVLHRIELTDLGSVNSAIEPKLHLTSWAVVTEPNATFPPESLELIDPELAWARHNYFWVGATSRIFKEAIAAADNRWGGFAWCGNNERDLLFPTFTVLKEPICEMVWTLAMLNRFANATTKRAAKFVGTVDDTAGGQVLMPPADLKDLPPYLIDPGTLLNPAAGAPSSGDGSSVRAQAGAAEAQERVAQRTGGLSQLAKGAINVIFPERLQTQQS